MQRFMIARFLLLNLIGGISCRVLRPRLTAEGRLRKQSNIIVTAHSFEYLMFVKLKLACVAGVQRGERGWELNSSSKCEESA